LRGDVPAGGGLERLVARVVRDLCGDAGEIAFGDDGLGPPLAAVVDQRPRLARGHRGVRLVAQLEQRAERLAPRRDAPVRRAAGALVVVAEVAGQNEGGEGALTVGGAGVLDGPHLGAERRAEPDGAAAADVLLEAERVAEV